MKIVQFDEAVGRYKRGACYQMDDEVSRYVDQGVAHIYGENKGILEDLPGYAELKKAGYDNLDDIMELYEDGMLQSVKGIGKKTEKEFIEYLNKHKDRL